MWGKVRLQPGELLPPRPRKPWWFRSRKVQAAKAETFTEAAKMARAMGLEAKNKGTMAHEMTERYFERLAVRFEERAKAFEDAPKAKGAP